MLAGHYSAAFVAKSVRPRVPLWLLLLAAQLVDVLWALFVLTGVEHVRFDWSLPSNPLDLYDMPLTHSLLGGLVWAAVGCVLARRWLAGTLEAIAVAGTVVSHWFLDLLVHRPDLTLWGGSEKVGLGLWNYPVTALVIEFALLAASVWLYVRSSRAVARRPLFILLGVLTVVQLSMTIAPPPVGTTQLGLTSLFLFLSVAAVGRRIDRASS